MLTLGTDASSHNLADLFLNTNHTFDTSTTITMNGINGGNMPAVVAGYPTPAGYQAELAYIYNMVEVLSQQLAENKRALEDVVSSVGRVRSRARTQSLGNDELITTAGDELGCTFPAAIPALLAPRPLSAPVPSD